MARLGEAMNRWHNRHPDSAHVVTATVRNSRPALPAPEPRFVRGGWERIGV
jgi:hypothetical protein